MVIGYWLFPFSLPAQSLTDTVKLPAISIKATPVARHNTEYIDSVRLLQHIGADLQTLLSASSGIPLKIYGGSGLSTPSIRGTGGGHTQMLWNNIPLNNSANGVLDLRLVPMILVDELTMQYGGAGLNSSTPGLGGTISLETSPWTRRDNPFSYRFGGQAGSFGNHSFFGKMHYGGKGWQAASRVYNSILENHYPYRNIAKPGHPEERLTHARIGNFGLVQSVGVSTGVNSQLQANVWYNTSLRQLPASIGSAASDETQEDEALRAHLRYLFGKKNSSFVDGGYLDEWLMYRQPSASIDSRLHTRKFFLQERTYINLKSHRFIAGFSSQYDWANSRNFDKPEGQSLIGVYGQWKHTFLKKFHVNSILRPELRDTKAMPLSGLLNLHWNILKDHKLGFYIQGSRQYHFPSLNDLYWEPGGNPLLEPEKSRMAEGGVESVWKKEKAWLMLSANVYSSWIDNYIQWKPGSGGYWESDNLKKVWARGAEASAEAGNRNAGIRLKYTFTRSTNIDDPLLKRKQLIYIPLHTFYTGGFYQYKSLRFSADYSYAGFRYTAADGSDWLPGYSLVSLYADWRIKNHIRLQAQVQNLFNTVYQSMPMRPMPGRAVVLTGILELN